MSSTDQDTKSEKKVPGDVSLVSSPEDLLTLSSQDHGTYAYTIEDYFAKPKAKSFQLSPDGKYLSYQEKDAIKKNHVYVKNLEDGKITQAIQEQEELIRGYGWANENRLIFVMDTGGDENYHIFATNVDGSDTKELTPFDGVQVQILQMLKEDKEHIIIGMNKTNKEVFEPYRINVNTGALQQLYVNDDIEHPIMDYIFDKNGELRGFTRLRNGVDIDLYYAKETDNYECLKELNWKDTFSIKSFSYRPENKHEAYVVSNLTSDRSEIYLYDLKEDKIIKKLFSDLLYDVSGLGLSRKRNFELDYFSFQGEKKVIVPVSTYYKKLHTVISNHFPDQQYAIADKTDNEDKYLVFIQSDVLYGVYYVYDVEEDSFELLYNLMPQLLEEEMATMQPISFKSRDGITIYGYLTLPKNIKPSQKVPLIVNPHGGPQGIRDTWGFNPENQLFASRGYATLQINFRISGGYGRKFLESGFKQIGRKAMDDVEDGIQYVISKGWIDEEKIAIYGGSHGGYAVLRGLTKTPDLYCCGVDYVGVSNLFSFMKTIPPYWKPYLKIIKEIWYDEDVAEENKIMKEVSPVFQIDKIKKPLFVVQGANDPRVNIDESDQIVRALRAKGFETPYMVKYDEGHGFAKEENSIEMYKAMMGFLAKHLK
ncbi:prolyl oligopeptidase family serine peptidase [Aquimarina sp. 2-A2]|uniref:S9 family peptidase n=1 Tax=Aquimarina sp. 2-A2 TaxID=3382644 RepID=UPI00387EECD4